MSFSWLSVNRSGNIVDNSGNTIRLRGLNTAGLEFGDGVADFTQARINAFASKFNMNLWRLAVNVSWWNSNVLMTDGVTHYQTWIQQVIGWMKTAGCYVEIDPTTWMTRPPANSGSYCNTLGNPPQTIQASDTFIRANQSGWGTSSGGQVWTNQGPSGTIALTSNEGVITLASGGGACMQPGSGTATDQSASIRLALTASGTGQNAGIALRFTDSNNTYLFFITTAGVFIGKIVGGGYTQLATLAKSFTSGTFYQMRAYAVGTTLYMRTWLDGTSEPNLWDTQVTDTDLASGGWGLVANNLSGTDKAQFDHFTADTPVTACIVSQDTQNFPPWTQAQMVSATQTFYTSFIGIYGTDPAILYEALNEPCYNSGTFFTDPQAANNAVINTIQSLNPNALIFVCDCDFLPHVVANDPDLYTQANLVWDLHLYDDITWTWQQKLIDFQPAFNFAKAHHHAVSIGEWNANTTNNPNGMGTAWASLAISQGIANTYYNADNLLQSDNVTLTAQGVIVASTFLSIAAALGAGLPVSLLVQKVTITCAGVNQFGLTKWVYAVDLGAFQSDLASILLRIANSADQTANTQTFSISQSNVVVVENLGSTESYSHTP